MSFLRTQSTRKNISTQNATNALQFHPKR